MRKIPITLNSDHEKVIGYLMLDDFVSDELFINSDVSWAFKNKELVGVTLISKPRVVIKNSPEPGGPWSRVGDTDYG